MYLRYLVSNGRLMKRLHRQSIIRKPHLARAMTAHRRLKAEAHIHLFIHLASLKRYRGQHGEVSPLPGDRRFTPSIALSVDQVGRDKTERSGKRGTAPLQVFGGGPWPSDVHQQHAIAQVGRDRWVGRVVEKKKRDRRLAEATSDQRWIEPGR